MRGTCIKCIFNSLFSRMCEGRPTCYPFLHFTANRNEALKDILKRLNSLNLHPDNDNNHEKVVEIKDKRIERERHILGMEQTTLEEVRNQKGRCKMNKAPRCNKICNRILKRFTRKTVMAITKTLHTMLSLRYFPKKWKSAYCQERAKSQTESLLTEFNPTLNNNVDTDTNTPLNPRYYDSQSSPLRDQTEILSLNQFSWSHKMNQMEYPNTILMTISCGVTRRGAFTTAKDRTICCDTALANQT